MLHVPSPFVQCALARKGGPGGLAPRAGGLGGPSAPPGQQGGLGGGTPPNVGSDNEFYAVSPVDVVLWRHYHMYGDEIQDFTFLSPFKKK